MGNKFCSQCQPVRTLKNLRQSQNQNKLLANNSQLKSFQQSQKYSEKENKKTVSSKNQSKYFDKKDSIGNKETAVLEKSVDDSSVIKLNQHQDSQLKQNQKYQITPCKQLGLVSKISLSPESNQNQFWKRQRKVTSELISQSFDKQIWNQLIQIEPDFQKNLKNVTHHLNYGWKEIKNGVFINNIPDGMYYILTKDMLYKGWTSINSLIPENFGLLISKKGYYKGNFVNGKAHGKGIFFGSQKMLTYEGKWVNGQLIKGKITYEKQNLYEGNLKNCVPHGYGILAVKNTDGKKIISYFQYFGHFKNGKFHGQGKFDCPDHTYTGKFEQGRKNGYGVILIKQHGEDRVKDGRSVLKNRKLQGLWKNDKIIQIN